MMDINEIREIANKFKSNGGKGITTIDMSWYMLNKIDKIDDKLDNVITKEECLQHRDHMYKRGMDKRTLVMSLLAAFISITAIILSVGK